VQTVVREEPRPGTSGPSDPLGGWSPEEVEEEFQALVAILLEVARPPSRVLTPPRPPDGGDQDVDRRPPRRERSPPAVSTEPVASV